MVGLGGGSRTRGGIRGEKKVLLWRSELQRDPWQQEPLSVNPGPVTASRVQNSSWTQPRTGKDTVTFAAGGRHREVGGWRVAEPEGNLKARPGQEPPKQGTGGSTSINPKSAPLRNTVPLSLALGGPRFPFWRGKVCRTNYKSHNALEESLESLDRYTSHETKQ